MENKYTSLEISRLIQSKVPNVETEKWWIWTDKKNPQIILLSTVESERWRYKRHLLFDGFHSRAYRLDDVLRAIQVWGEKQGWKPTEYTIGDSRVCLIHGDEDLVDCDGTEYDPGGLGCAMCGDSIGDLVYRDEYHCHRLLTAYIEDGLQFGERCERVIKSIFEV